MARLTSYYFLWLFFYICRPFYQSHKGGKMRNISCVWPSSRLDGIFLLIFSWISPRHKLNLMIVARVNPSIGRRLPRHAGQTSVPVSGKIKYLAEGVGRGGESRLFICCDVVSFLLIENGNTDRWDRPMFFMGRLPVRDRPYQSRHVPTWSLHWFIRSKFYLFVLIAFRLIDDVLIIILFLFIFLSGRIDPDHQKRKSIRHAAILIFIHGHMLICSY